MLKILFSPSEGKKNGGSEKAKELLGSNAARKDILVNYQEIMKNNKEDEIINLFGIKNFKECLHYINDPFNAPLMLAIQRYKGVAYDYLQYEKLTLKAQKYLQENTIIFSNLYGPIKGGDTIINYKVKQGNSVGDIIPEKFYKERFSYQLDLYLSQDDILDLRAGYYEKFYKPTKQYTTLKFLKDGKVVSHWAKAYRGLVLKAIAENNITSLEAFQKLEIENLQVKEIQIKKNITQIIYEIVG